MAIEDRIRAEYPHLAWALNVPELKGLLLQMDTMTPQAFQAALYGSTYYRITSESQRQWAALQGADPATAQRRLDERRDQVRRIAQSLQSSWEGGGEFFFGDVAMRSLQNGWDEDRITAEILNVVQKPGVQGTGSLRTSEDQVRSIAAAYFMPVSEQTALMYAKRIALGETSPDDLRAVFMDQAKQLFPHLTKQLETGMTLRDAFAPVQNRIASILELNPNDVDPMANDRWRAPMDFVDDKGNHRMMTDFEVAKWARSQAEFRNTRQARDQVAELGDSLLRSFGEI